jgi:tripartite-type tricarboxylate transporter receptor subunit TctC
MACPLGGRKTSWLLVALVWVLGANAVWAQDWPMKQPIKVISPASAGSTSDIMARIVFDQVGRYEPTLPAVSGARFLRLSGFT